MRIEATHASSYTRQGIDSVSVTGKKYGVANNVFSQSFVFGNKDTISDLMSLGTD